MSEQQISKMVATLVEHQRNFVSMPTDECQWVIQNTKQAIGIFCEGVKSHLQTKKDNSSRRVNNPDGTISFFVKVDRSLTPQQMLDETGRRQCTNSSVVANMPKGEGDEVEVVFFKHGHRVSDDLLEKEYEKQNLIPADPYSVVAVNRDEPFFANDHPNGTHWRDGNNNNWCYAAFGRWSDERRVYVYRDGFDWVGYWWFAALRKPR